MKNLELVGAMTNCGRLRLIDFLRPINFDDVPVVLKLCLVQDYMCTCTCTCNTASKTG